MTPTKPHDLYDFMKQISTEMAAEYDRVRKRATEDSGTAGNQGEENWATLLRDWLPSTYEVVTKGRIIGQDGKLSRQIDVIVLKSSYPKKLLDKKLYLAAGVAAAFECKITLKSSHITKAVEHCAKIKSLYPERSGTPYKELHSPLFYGLVAHSHSWKGKRSTPEENIERKLIEEDRKHINHPRKQLDILCIADLGAWTSTKQTFFGPCHVGIWSGEADANIYGANGSAITFYSGHTQNNESQVSHFTPIGVLISELFQKMAWEDPAHRDLADYYRVTNIAGSGKGSGRTWPSTIYTVGTRARIEKGQLSNGLGWDEWSIYFM